jgi:leucyl/phenylalanyl-tRNA--protein transferase
VITWLHDADAPFPDTRRALPARSEAPGLLAAGGTLTPQRLLMAYSRGIFPWFSEGQPVLWWSPDPRMVLPVADFRLSHSLRKTLQRFISTPGSEVRIDGNFRRVMECCAKVARTGQDGTWIVPAMVDAYSAWHVASGAPHSFETWVDGELVGGLYGVALGRMFFGESMFSLRTDASKIALAALVAFCRANGIALIDCQQNTAHLASMGAREISRAAFERHLGATVRAEPVHDWTYDPSLWTRLDERLVAPSLVKD